MSLVQGGDRGYSSRWNCGIPAREAAISSVARTSDLLISLISAGRSSHAEVMERVTLGELMAALRNRAFGLSLLLFGLPNLLPAPGLPILCGLVLLVLSLQIAAGRDTLWLPERVARISVPRPSFEGLVRRAMPLLRRAESLSRPRGAVASGKIARRIIGVCVFLLAIELVVVPLPWIGSAPQGFAISLFGLGLVERDGFFVIAGFAVATLAMSIGAGIAYAVWSSVGLLF